MKRDNEKRVSFAGPSIVKVHLNLRFVKGSGGFLVSALSLKREAVELKSLKAKRRRFDDKAKKEVVAAAREHGLHEAARRANNTAGFESVDCKTIRRWRKALEGEHPKKIDSQLPGTRLQCAHGICS